MIKLVFLVQGEKEVPRVEGSRGMNRRIHERERNHVFSDQLGNDTLDLRLCIGTAFVAGSILVSKPPAGMRAFLSGFMLRPRNSFYHFFQLACIGGFHNISITHPTGKVLLELAIG